MLKKFIEVGDDLFPLVLPPIYRKMYEFIIIINVSLGNVRVPEKSAYDSRR